MGFRGLVTAAASVALMATPTIAAAQHAAAATTEVTPGGEAVDGSEMRGGFILPLIGIAALILVIVLATRHHHHNTLPTSP